MSDFNVRSDAVNVEQIMEQIRARIREKRGVDYTEAQIRELAAVKLEKFLDPKVVRSDLLEQFQRVQAAQSAAANVTFGPNALFEARRPIVRTIRRWLHPVLRLFFNPDPLSQALLRLNDIDPRADMYYELFHNLVIELTRTSIEVKNLKMRVESLTGRLEFNERRARALESAVVYAPSNDEQAATPRSGGRLTIADGGGRHVGSVSTGSRPLTSSGPSAPASAGQTPGAGPRPLPEAGSVAEGPGQRSRRRRRRRGRRGGGSAAMIMGTSATSSQPDSSTDIEHDLGTDTSPDASPVSEPGSTGGQSEAAEPRPESAPRATTDPDPSDEQ